ncbi:MULTISPECIES: DUF6188 family protein [Priestia]|uniref:DUF6188 family protein n=2 Tax=Priestia TaxID=2800373 RepID=A0AAX6N7P5_PRIAR|nr:MULTISPECIES: DUF6188 family protein [Priestia]AEN88941.1 hypothetical protein BMWSH_2059 [Priestia megaterium WSH-002]MBY0064759.1 hypothetical protein [Priestia aryabhattai]MDN3363312.1 DUF6188 family protein [Priestia megaterium]MDU9691504.1 DUF6188 family protein [Priestia aryabhattai]MED5245382.1 DUF6188 family protein [Priestia sp. LL-8]
MNNSSTVINFSYFQEQTVTKVNTDNTLPFSLVFSKGGLVAECPWRLKNKRSILLGQADWKSAHSAEQRQQVEALLLGQHIISIQWYEDIGILRITFSNGYALDMFHDSSFFEGWDLYGQDGFSFISLPGGACDHQISICIDSSSAYERR